MAFRRFELRWLVFCTVLLLAVAVPEAYTCGYVAAQTSTRNAKKKTTASKSSNSQKKTGSDAKKSTRRQKVSKNKQSSKPSASSSRQPKKSTGSTPKSSAEARRLQDAAQREIQETKERIRLNEQEIKTGLSDLNRLTADIKTGREKVDGLQKKVATLGNDITVLGNEISRNESDLRLMREEYLKAVKKMRLTKKNQSVLAFIFSSDNFNQAMRRLRYMRQFSAWKEKKSADIDSKILQLEEERKRLSDAKEAQTVALGQLSKSQEELETRHKEQQRLVSQLRQNGDLLQKHLAAKQAEANNLKSTISALIAQEQAKAEAERKAREKAEAERKAREKAEAERIAAEKAAAEKAAAEKALAEKTAADKAAADKEKSDKKFAEAKAKAEEKARKEKEKQEKKDKKNSENGARNRRGRRAAEEERKKVEALKEKDALAAATPKNTEKAVEKAYAGKDFASLRGSLPCPVDGVWRITNPFGRHSMPELPEIEYDNPGIDAEVSTGAAVKAVYDGKVSGVYKLDGYGTVVIVNHGDYYTVYGNLSSANVSVGSQVGSGQALGVAGVDPDNPRHGSVHFEVWKGREKQNPSSWLR